MADAYISEIRMFAFNYAPRSWSLCNGGLQSISQNTSLFSLIGIAYGGDGRNTFALPNLIGRAPLSFGTGPGLSPYVFGKKGDLASMGILPEQMPTHKHTAYTRITSTIADVTDVQTDAYLSRMAATDSAPPFYNAPPGAGQVIMAPESLQKVGTGESHENRQPYLTVNFCICQYGIYPPRS